MLYQLSHFRSMRDHRRNDGAESQIRTGDTAIFSRVLYQLSYLGPMANQARSPVGGAEDSTGPDGPSIARRPPRPQSREPSGARPTGVRAFGVRPAADSSIRLASRRSR